MEFTELEQQYAAEIETTLNSMKALVSNPDSATSALQNLQKVFDSSALTFKTEAMHAIWSYMARQMHSRTHSQSITSNGLPSEVVELAEQIMSVARTKAVQELDSQRETMQQQFVEQKDLLEKRHETLTKEHQQLLETLEEEQEQRVYLQNCVQNAEAKLVDLNNENQQLLSDLKQQQYDQLRTVDQIESLNKQLMDMDHFLDSAKIKSDQLLNDNHQKDLRIQELEEYYKDVLTQQHETSAALEEQTRLNARLSEQFKDMQEKCIKYQTDLADKAKNLQIYHQQEQRFQEKEQQFQYLLNSQKHQYEQALESQRKEIIIQDTESTAIILEEPKKKSEPKELSRVQTDHSALGADFAEVHQHLLETKVKRKALENEMKTLRGRLVKSLESKR